MLIKSIKHDLMATYRDFVGIYVALLVAAIIGPFVVQVGNSIINILALILLSGLTIATLIITFLTIIRLYNRRLFSNEGYLTMTLPVKTHITIISKVITGMIWSFATSVVFTGSALIFYGIYIILYNVFGMTVLSDFINFLNELASSLLQWDVLASLLVQILDLVNGARDLILLVFIMTFVNTSFIKKGKLAIGVAAYMILGSIFNWITSGALFLVGGAAYMSSGSGTVLINGFEFGGALNLLVYGIQFSLASVFILILGFATWWLLEHKLEVE